VRYNILSGEVRNEFLIAIAFLVENKQHLFPVVSSTKLLTAEVHSEFQGHIESRQSIRSIQLRARYIVDPEFAALDQAQQLFDSHLGEI
jgi:hypothetical protein